MNNGQQQPRQAQPRRRSLFGAADRDAALAGAAVFGDLRVAEQQIVGDVAWAMEHSAVLRQLGVTEQVKFHDFVSDHWCSVCDRDPDRARQKGTFGVFTPGSPDHRWLCGEHIQAERCLELAHLRASVQQPLDAAKEAVRVVQQGLGVAVPAGAQVQPQQRHQAKLLVPAQVQHPRQAARLTAVPPPAGKHGSADEDEDVEMENAGEEESDDEDGGEEDDEETDDDVEEDYDHDEEDADDEDDDDEQDDSEDDYADDDYDQEKDGEWLPSQDHARRRKKRRRHKQRHASPGALQPSKRQKKESPLWKRVRVKITGYQKDVIATRAEQMMLSGRRSTVSVEDVIATFKDIPRETFDETKKAFLHMVAPDAEKHIANTILKRNVFVLTGHGRSKSWKDARTVLHSRLRAMADGWLAKNGFAVKIVTDDSNHRYFKRTRVEHQHNQRPRAE